MLLITSRLSVAVLLLFYRRILYPHTVWYFNAIVRFIRAIHWLHFAHTTRSVKSKVYYIFYLTASCLSISEGFALDLFPIGLPSLTILAKRFVSIRLTYWLHSRFLFLDNLTTSCTSHISVISVFGTLYLSIFPAIISDVLNILFVSAVPAHVFTADVSIPPYSDP